MKLTIAVIGCSSSDMTVSSEGSMPLSSSGRIVSISQCVMIIPAPTVTIDSMCLSALSQVMLCNVYNV